MVSAIPEDDLTLQRPSQIIFSRVQDLFVFLSLSKSSPEVARPEDAVIQKRYDHRLSSIAPELLGDDLSPENTHSPPPVSNQHRIPSLDGLRAISIIGILLSHFWQLPTNTRLGWFFHSVPSNGVRVFFVISGFLITSLMLGEEEKRGRVDLGSFYVRRAFRILPAAFFYLLIAGFLFRNEVSTANLLLAGTFLGNMSQRPDWIVGHFWTLANEEQFYLLWPILFVIFRSYRKTLLMAAMITVPLINLVLIRFELPFLNHALFSVGDILAVGCLLGTIWNTTWRERIADFTRPTAFWLILPPLCAAFWVNDIHIGEVGSVAKTLLFRPFMGIAIALIVARVVLYPPKLLNCEPIMYIGRLSYSLYLWQQLFVHRENMSLWVRLTLILACAAFSYHVIERPALSLRHRLNQSNKSQAA